MHKPPESSPGKFVSDLQEDFAQSKEIHFERFTLGYLSDKPCSDYCRSGLILSFVEIELKPWLVWLSGLSTSL